MRIGIISDTHLTHKTAANLPEGIPAALREVDLLIHCGDYTHREALEYFQRHHNFAGVWGNADDQDIQAILREKLVIEAHGHRIGVFHGHGSHRTTQDRALEAFQGESVDIIAYGHSHQPLIQTKGGILMLNPGSITNKRKERLFSYILLTLAEDIRAELCLYHR